MSEQLHAGQRPSASLVNKTRPWRILSLFVSLLHIAELVPFVAASLVRAEPTSSSVCFLPSLFSSRLVAILSAASLISTYRNKLPFPLEFERGIKLAYHFCRIYLRELWKKRTLDTETGLGESSHVSYWMCAELLQGSIFVCLSGRPLLQTKARQQICFPTTSNATSFNTGQIEKVFFFWFLLMHSS